MTDLQDLRIPRSTVSPPDEAAAPPGHDGAVDDAGSSGTEHGGSPPEPPPARAPRWRWVALAAALLALLGLAAIAYAYQGSQDDLADAEDRITVLVLAGEADAVLLTEAVSESGVLRDEAATLRDEAVTLNDRVTEADAIIADTDAAVVELFTADTGEEIPGVSSEQLVCMSEAMVTGMGSAAVLRGLVAFAANPEAPEATIMGLSMIGASEDCGIPFETLAGVPGA